MKKDAAHVHEDGTLPPENDSSWIWVFGSNQMGVHGAGAALVARLRFGAQPGFGEGLMNRSYAVPTKTRPTRGQSHRISLVGINSAVASFALTVARCPDLKFWLTRVGCGLAGYEDKDIAPLFRINLAVYDVDLSRISIPDTWVPFFVDED